MGSLTFTHAAGREVYGDEPRYSEEWLEGDGPFHKGENGNLLSGVCDPANLIERRVSPLQFGADGKLILPTVKADLTHSTGCTAFIDCLLEGRPFCHVGHGPKPVAINSAARAA